MEHPTLQRRMVGVRGEPELHVQRVRRLDRRRDDDEHCKCPGPHDVRASRPRRGDLLLGHPQPADHHPAQCRVRQRRNHLHLRRDPTRCCEQVARAGPSRGAPSRALGPALIADRPDQHRPARIARARHVHARHPAHHRRYLQRGLARRSAALGCTWSGARRQPRVDRQHLHLCHASAVPSYGRRHLQRPRIRAHAVHGRHQDRHGAHHADLDHVHVPGPGREEPLAQQLHEHDREQRLCRHVARLGSSPAPTTVPLLNSPEAMAWDTAGNMYVMDTGNKCVRKVTPETAVLAGTITTYAGNCTSSGTTGNDVLATDSTVKFSTSAEAIAVDGAGNVFVADTNNDRIRRITASDGKIHTIAGTGIAGNTGDGISPASGFRISAPAGIVVTSDGTVYFTDRGNNKHPSSHLRLDAGDTVRLRRPLDDEHARRQHRNLEQPGTARDRHLRRDVRRGPLASHSRPSHRLRHDVRVHRHRRYRNARLHRRRGVDVVSALVSPRRRRGLGHPRCVHRRRQQQAHSQGHAALVSDGSRRHQHGRGRRHERVYRGGVPNRGLGAEDTAGCRLSRRQRRQRVHRRHVEQLGPQDRLPGRPLRQGDRIHVDHRRRRGGLTQRRERIRRRRRRRDLAGVGLTGGHGQRRGEQHLHRRRRQPPHPRLAPHRRAHDRRRDRRRRSAR